MRRVEPINTDGINAPLRELIQSCAPVRPQADDDGVAVRHLLALGGFPHLPEDAVAVV
jgi:hypothetical protein